MNAAHVVQSLAHFRSQMLWISLALFVVVNVALVVSALITRDRALVNRMTGRILAFDLLLIGGGVGVSAFTAVSELAVRSLAPTSAAVTGMNAAKTATLTEPSP